jgi:hypothetical protein
MEAPAMIIRAPVTTGTWLLLTMACDSDGSTPGPVATAGQTGMTPAEAHDRGGSCLEGLPPLAGF